MGSSMSSSASNRHSLQAQRFHQKSFNFLKSRLSIYEAAYGTSRFLVHNSPVLVRHYSYGCFKTWFRLRYLGSNRFIFTVNWNQPKIRFSNFILKSAPCVPRRSFLPVIEGLQLLQRLEKCWLHPRESAATRLVIGDHRHLSKTPV
jgi:hypothetical protein